MSVTAYRTPTRIDQTLAEVSVIDRQAIEQAQGHTLTELLARQPGLQFTASGGLGKNSSISIHGLADRHTLVLIDGVRHGSATAGAPSLDNLPLNNIERIEIVRGPLSSLYGSEAVGGVVQIFTRRSRAGFQANAGVSFGTHRYGNATAGVGFGNERWDAAVQVGHVQTPGFSATNERVPFGAFNPDSDAFRQNSGNLQVGLKLGGDWQLKGRALQARGITEFDDGPDANARAKMQSEVLSFELSGHNLPKWRSVMRVSQSIDKSTSLATASPYVDLGTFGTEQLQLSREDSIETPVGVVLLVAEYLRQSVEKPAAAYDVAERRVLGASAGLNGKLGAHTWQSSVRHDRNSQFGSQNTGSLGYGFELTPQWRLGASYGTSFVAPSFNSLYYPDYGNPALQPEKGTSTELSVRYTAGEHQVRGALFEHRLRGYISASDRKAINIARAHVNGLSLGYQGKVLGWVSSASYEHLNPINESESATQGRVLPRRARNLLKAGIERSFGNFSFGSNLQVVGARFDDVGNVKPVVGRYTTLDASAQWRFAPQWTLAANLNNLGNKRYETITGYNQPGSQAFVSLRYAMR